MDEVKIWYLFYRTWWDSYYKENCHNWNLKPTNYLMIGTAYKVPGSMSPREAASNLRDRVLQARSLGFEVVPEYTTRFHIGHGEVGNLIETWFDIKVWKEQASYISSIAPITMDGTKRFAIDLEPYWSGESRYPKPEDYDKLATAMKPFVDSLKNAKIDEVWAFPGSIILNYQYFKVLAEAGLNVSAFDESTYSIPDAFYKNPEEYALCMEQLKNNKNYHAEVGINYYPGFYETALKQPGFTGELRDQGIRNAWVFPRSGVSFYPDDVSKGNNISRHHRFFTPEWFNWELYKEYWEEE